MARSEPFVMNEDSTPLLQKMYTPERSVEVFGTLLTMK